MNTLLALVDEKARDLVLITFSAPLENIAEKVTLKPVLIKKKLHFQLVFFEKTRCITKNIEESDLRKTIETIFLQYENAFLRFQDEEMHVSRKKDGKLSIKKKMLEMIQTPDLSHNRKKNYILEEGKFFDWLYELGIQKKDGTIVSGSRDKFIQVNRFLEIVEDILPDILPDIARKLRIVDVGCGKGYLTFALYYYLHTVLQLDCEIIGIDLKEDVVEACNQLAEKVGFSHLHFQKGNISEFQAEEIDFVISLHACDTATCFALYQAIKWQAKALLAAPCCQHEIASQIQPEALDVVLCHGIFRERFSAILTDSLRILLLEAFGYKVQALEFIDPEHTPKNLLIRAVKKTNSINQDKLDQYEKIAKQFGISLCFARLLKKQI